MTVYCLLPVHNRLEATQQVLAAFRTQSYPGLHVIVIDDGSTDGTAEYLRENCPDVEVIPGNGKLWWTGAIREGLAVVLGRAKTGDYVLLQNNDTHFKSDYVSTLVSVSDRYDGAVVGSPLRDAAQPGRTFSLGPKINYFETGMEDLIYLRANRVFGVAADPMPDAFEVVETDALSGRGTLYPIEVLWKCGSVRARLMPHYWADYELSARAKRAGSTLLVALAAPVWTSADVSGINMRNANLLEVLLSRKSQVNIFHTLLFFSLAGPWYHRLTAIPRVLMWKIWRILKRRMASIR